MPPVTELDLEEQSGFGVAVDGSAKAWPGYYLPPRLPTLDSLTARPTYIEVFPRGAAPAPVTVTADKPWVTIREDIAFGISPHDRRYWIDVDWTQAPVGRAEAVVKIQGEGEDSVSATLTAIRATPEQARAARGAFGGLDGAFAVPAAGYARSVAVGGVRWEAIPDYGRVDAAMSIFPVDAPSIADPMRAPRLEYDVYLAAAGDYVVDLTTGPTLEVIPGRKLSVAVSLDEQAAQQDADLAYAADIGTFGKSRPAIDKAGIEWRDRRTALTAAWSALGSNKAIGERKSYGHRLPDRVERPRVHHNGRVQERRHLRGIRS